MKMIELLVFSLIYACASYKGEQSYELKENIKYGDHERQVGDIYLVDPKSPFVVVIHGGGWSSRDKSDMNNISKSLATNGFNVFSINYRYAPEHVHPAQSEDVEKAVNFLRKIYQLTSKIGFWGYSAGAHLSLMYGLQNPSGVGAIVSGGAPYDLSWYECSPIIGPYLGFHRPGRIKEYLAASPISYLSEDAPPMFLYHGIKDDLVEYAQMQVFYTKALLKGVEVKTLNVPFWGHVNTFVFAAKPVKSGLEFLKKKLQ